MRAVPCLVAAAALALASCGGSHGTSGPSTTGRPPTTRPVSTSVPPSTAVPTTTPPTVPRGWSRHQLVAQLIMVGASYADPAASAEAVRDGAGGLVFFGQPAAGSAPALTRSLAALRGQAAEAPWFASDEEGGGVERLSALTGALPWPRQMRAQWSPAEMAGRVAQVASRMRALGVDMDLAPVLDTAAGNDPVDAEAQRSFDENPAVATTYGLAFMRALNAQNVVSVVKHFPGLGHADGDTDRGPARVPPLATLAGNDLVPFRRAIDAGARVVMMSNATEPDWGTRPASLNPAAYAYLRGLGFRGVILTDSLDADAIRSTDVGGAQAAVEAIEAGADMAMITVPSEYPAAVAELDAAVVSGRLPMAQVVRSVDRILAAKR